MSKGKQKSLSWKWAILLKILAFMLIQFPQVTNAWIDITKKFSLLESKLVYEEKATEGKKCRFF